MAIRLSSRAKRGDLTDCFVALLLAMTYKKERREFIVSYSTDTGRQGRDNRRVVNERIRGVAVL